MTEEASGSLRPGRPRSSGGHRGQCHSCGDQDLNQDVLVVDRGAYLRVLVPQMLCRDPSAIEKHLGRPFRFPGELETVMSAFKGSLQLNQDDASWRFGRSGNPTEARRCVLREVFYGSTEDLLASVAAKRMPSEYEVVTSNSSVTQARASQERDLSSTFR